MFDITPFGDVCDRGFRILSSGRAGLITDVDGTISAIADRPEGAFVSDEARAHLVTLTWHLAVVGAVSGRAAPDVAQMVGISAMVYAGNHGMEFMQDGRLDVDPVAMASSAAVAAALGEIEAELIGGALRESIILENKGVTASVHYRLAPSHEVARDYLQPRLELATRRHGLRLTEGRLVFELRPNLVINKGTATAAIIQRHRLDGCLFLGDDVTDIDGFRAVRALGEHGLAVAVVAEETQPTVFAEADVSLAGVSQTVRFLAEMVRRFESPTGTGRADA